MADTEPQPIDLETTRELAGFVVDNMDEIAREMVLCYRELYTHSTNARMDDEGALRWAKGCLLSLAAQLEAGRPDPNGYQDLSGDIVLQHYGDLYQIDAYMEQCLHVGNVVAELLWERTVGDTRTMNRLLSTFEAFIQLMIRVNLETFARAISQPRALVRAWRLGHHRFEQRKGEGRPQTAPNTETQASPPPSADPLGPLTAREADIALIVAAGKSNKEAANMLGLQLSTVRNVLSRVYDKLGISGRSELIVLLAGRQA